MADSPRLTWLGKLVIALVVGGCLYAAWWYFSGALPGFDAFRRGSRPAAGATDPGTPGTAGAAGDVGPRNADVEIGIAYGTEKKLWLEAAARQFAETREGRRVRVNLIPLGSIEGAQAIVAGDKRIHVWSPASAVYKDTFVQDWTARHGGNPIVREENLALTPMVFVFWDERYRAFAGKYKAATFATVRSALGEQGGWAAIANRPDWGLFKFGHTHPGQSNSGVMTLVAMAYEFRGKSRGLELSDILDPSFQSAMAQVERGVTGLANSTGTMMREMVLKGPSSFDALFVYENIAIEYLKSAEGRWGSLRVVYPALNLWNENPYYVLDAPWSDRRQREAAGAFLDFLMSEPIQKQALTHGFRPGNPTVPVRTPDSPFTLYARQGLQVDLGTVCEPPRAEVVANLLQSWQRQFAR